jgi:hypothetical protein
MKSINISETQNEQTMLSAFTATYSNYLTALKAEKAAAVISYQAAQREDESKFAKIELNVVDIFEKMYAASVAKLPKEAKTLSVSQAPKEAEWQALLKETYLGFFEKIPTAWFQNLEKCEQFDCVEEAHVERVKIAQMLAIKSIFVDMISAVAKETTYD